MEKEKGRPGRGDVRWGRELARLERLATRSGKTFGEVARQALIEYELSQSEFKDTVRDAILALFQVLIPDEQFDPAEDTRQEEAVQALGSLLNSNFAAEGIAEAFTLLFTMNMFAMSALRFPSTGNQDEFCEDQLLGQDVERNGD